VASTPAVACRTVAARDAGDAVLAAVRARWPEWEVDALAPVGAGLEFTVYRAVAVGHGEVAIRVPHARWISNANDPMIDARDLLAQEWAILTALHARGLPVPAPIACATGAGEDGLDLLVTAFVGSDGTEPDPREAGALLAALHALEPPVARTVVQFDRPLAALLAERTARRVGVAASLTGEAIDGPSVERLETAIGTPAPTSLLHLDFRPANLLCRDGRIAAVIDWSNALVGDPALELARVAESGLLDDAFIGGYGRDPFAGVPRDRELAYRLDTAAMLAVVFLSEAPDPALARHHVERVVELCRGLRTT